MIKVEWLCSRCADKEDKETEPDPVVLRLCTSCKVETYVRPFAHFGEAREPTPEEIEEAKAFHEQKLKVLKKATENRKAKEAEEYKEAEKQVLEAETVEEKVEDIIEEAVEEIMEVVEEAEPEDPYKGLTKTQLVELLKEKE